MSDTDPSAVPPDGRAVDLDSAFRMYGRHLAWVGTRILGRPEDVDDLVQEVFVDAIRGLDQLRDPAAARAWLTTLAVRKARRMLAKRRMRRFLGLDDGADYEDLAASGASPAEKLMIADLYRLLDALPTEERLAWTLRYVEGEKLDRVAELCECSLATAKRRIAHAHATLGGDLGDD